MSQPKKKFSNWSLLVFILIILFVEFFVINASKMSGDSMIPNLKDEGYYVVKLQFFTRNLLRDDVIVYRASYSKNHVIKRIIGLPNETITLQGGMVYMNGNLLDESKYKQPSVLTQGGSFFRNGESIVVPYNSYFVLGDNRSQSSDSRENGFVQEKDILGVVWFCFLRCSE